MPETTQTIGQWIADTFPGADPASPRTALRLLEEVVELCLVSGASPGNIRHTVIKTVYTEATKVFQSDNEHRPRPDKIPGEAADVGIVLHALAALKGIDLQAEIDKKMAVNRARKWRALGDGTGYHVKEPADGTQNAGGPPQGELAQGQPAQPEAGAPGA